MHQEQFLNVIDRDEAERRFRAALDLRPLGAEEVTIVSLESYDELLIVPEDLEQAKEEGVQFKPNTACARILGKDGAVSGAVLAEAHLEKDEEGNVAPKIHDGTEWALLLRLIKGGRADT